MLYELKVVDMLVQDWSKDGVGENLFSKGSLDIPCYIDGQITRKSIVEAIKKDLNIDIEESDLYFDYEYGSFSVVEDNDANQDKDGNWLVDYSFTITPCPENIDLNFLADDSSMPIHIEVNNGNEIQFRYDIPDTDFIHSIQTNEYLDTTEKVMSYISDELKKEFKITDDTKIWLP